jgi:hypothetical protein
MPVLVLIPALFGFGRAAVAIPIALFFLWNPELFKGAARTPKRSYVLMITATLLGIPWFAVGWKDGIAAQGARYNYSVLAVNIAWATVLWVLFTRNRKREPSFTANLLFHWVLFAWLAWYAFPFFGEFI